MSKFAVVIVLVVTVFFGTNKAQTSAPLLIEDLAVNQTHIAFSHAGNIWLIDRAGGSGPARRLTDGKGENRFPKFSPDGREIAFSNNGSGSYKIFVMPVSGGAARQLTYLPENDTVEGWTPDGRKILFVSHRDEEAVNRLYTIEKNGVLPEALPLPIARSGSFSEDGTRIAYSPKALRSGWRYYRGGFTGEIWIAEPATGAIEKIPGGDFNNKFPMWMKDKIYFVSDRSGHANLFAFDTNSKQTEQLTDFDKYGITAAAAGGGAIVFVRAGRIYLYDAAEKTAKMVDVRLDADRSELAEKQANAAGAIDWILPTNSENRVVVNARGEVLLFDPQTKETKNLTNTSGIAERFPAVSPDNRFVAYFSDESGEYRLHIRSLENGQVRKIAIEQIPSFYGELKWSPDSKRLTFTGKRLDLWIADTEKGEAKRIDKSVYSYQQRWYPDWSPDGRWLVYSKHLKNRIRTIFVYDLQTGQSHQVSDGITHTESPVFDKNGKYLYFIWSPNAGTSEYGWGVLNGMMNRPLVRRNVGVFILQNDVPAPFMINGSPNPEAKVEETAANVRIDFENIRQRTLDLPLRARDYARLTAGKAGKLYAFVTEWGELPGFLDSPPQALYRFDLSSPEKFDRVAENIEDYDLSDDRGRLLYLTRRDTFLIDPDSENKAADGKLDFSNLKVKVIPQEEWRQIYREAWRVMRDWFYDPNHHGQNLGELEKHFAEYLPNVSRRSDLNDLMQEMFDHISVSHLNVGGGDVVNNSGGSRSSIGLLGADYEIDRGKYRFKKIYRTSHFNDPGGFAPAPLDQPGMNVREGEYLLAVGDVPVDATRNIYSYFEGTRGRPTKISIGKSANGDGARTLTVIPLAGENGLRRANWAERNRRVVEEKTGGRVGYIFVSDYGPGILDFMRGVSGYSDREAIIIDQRFNGGGITPDYLIEWLRREPLYYYHFREGDDIPTPVNIPAPAKVLITNEYNGSAAETFAFMYKLGKVGPLVGKRTIGGGIGPYVYTPRFIDGGQVRLPNRAAYNPEGKDWGIENIGVEPDYEVEITPKDWLAGEDPQLNKAIEVALSEIKKNPRKQPKLPAFPVHP